MTEKTIDSGADLVGALIGFQAAAIQRPMNAVRAGMNAAQALVESATGDAPLTPERGDTRFRDDIWLQNPFYRTMMSGYLASTTAASAWVEGLAIDERDKNRARFLLEVASSTLSPTNTVLGNPQAIRETLATGGMNLVKGAEQLVRDALDNGGLPSMVKKTAFRPGENLALSEGAVVYREDHLELIQYAPTTETAHATPVLIVPPQINKFYVWDLAPGRSIVEYLTGLGHTVFIVGWNNPGAEHADWGINSYIEALDRASDVVMDITGAPSMNVVGACSGGITAAMLLALWGARGETKANSFSLFVSILDPTYARNTALGLFANIETLELARLFSRSKGILGGKDLERAFAWLRPNDLIWKYWVNNYLLGKEPPAFDILYWNGDVTNLPAQLHSDMLELLEQGGLSAGKTWTIGEHEIKLSDVTCDTFVVAGESDHITPWDGCYMSARALGGDTEFVLSQSGHIQSLINPVGNPKARYVLNGGTHETPEAFREGASEETGSWWPHWGNWLESRAGKRVAAADAVGSDAYPALTAAPGTYVHKAA